MEGFFCTRSTAAIRCMRLAAVRRAVPVLAALALAACGSGQEGAGSGASLSDADGSAAVQTTEQLQAASSAYAGRDVAALMADDGAMGVAAQIYRAHCASCHGAEGRGGRKGPDLSAGHYNYGATPEAIRTTFMQGRKSVMPAMGGSTLGEVDLGELVAYVQSLSKGSEPSSAYEIQGKALFAQHCVVCHGEDGRGSVEKGAPNLADDYWRNGSSMMNMRLAMTRGLESECPAQGAKLTEAQANLLVAYVSRLIEEAVPQPGG